ncbi:SURF1 family protein [Proteobacteria bacterium 005FR1]|nr:SURF1 family protein [Proteobacteria bacterium 005FR1]
MRLALSLNIKVTILAVLVLPVLLALGNWQLQRADDKRAIQASFLARQQQEPVPIDAVEAEHDLAFTPIKLTGQFDRQRYFLLDNRVRAGQVGYEVLMPFRTEEEIWVLVNRGWIKGQPDRRALPEVPVPDGPVTTTGSVYVPLGDPFLLAEQDFTDASWPLVAQAVEMDKFADALSREIFPYVIRLDENAPGALQISWEPINVQPEKHLGYAVQWFAMAIALVIWFVFANTNLAQVLRAVARRR